MELKENDIVMIYQKKLLGKITDIIDFDDDDGKDDYGRTILIPRKFYKIEWFDGTYDLLKENQFEAIQFKNYPCLECDHRKMRCHSRCVAYKQASHYLLLVKYYEKEREKLDNDSWAKNNRKFHKV